MSSQRLFDRLLPLQVEGVFDGCACDTSGDNVLDIDAERRAQRLAMAFKPIAGQGLKGAKMLKPCLQSLAFTPPIEALTQV